MIPYWLSRTELLLGSEKTENLLNKHVLIVGLGGVGGICAEMIARAGVGKLTIVDADTIDLSNCNRQIAALHSTEKKSKAQVIADRLKDINPVIEINVKEIYIQDTITDELLDDVHYDYAVDCIDTLSPKAYFLKKCVDRNLPVVSSLGAGGKIDPTQIQITDISKSYQCNLAKYLRRKLRYMGIKKGIKVIFSPEAADQNKIIETEKAYPKKSLIGTISYMPAMFGCMCASVVIRDLYEN